MSKVHLNKKNGIKNISTKEQASLTYVIHYEFYRDMTAPANDLKAATNK